LVAHLSTVVLRCVDNCHTLPYLGVTCGLLVWRWVSHCFYIVQVQKDIASWFTNRIIILYIMKSRALKDEELMGRDLVDNETTSSSHLICCISADICIVSILNTWVVYPLFPEVMPFLDLSWLIFDVKSCTAARASQLVQRNWGFGRTSLSYTAWGSSRPLHGDVWESILILWKIYISPAFL